MHKCFGKVDDFYILFSIYLTLSVVKTRRAMNGGMIVHNEQGRMWKEMDIA
jgi:hypothetical protein